MLGTILSNLSPLGLLGIAGGANTFGDLLSVGLNKVMKEWFGLNPGSEFASGSTQAAVDAAKQLMPIMMQGAMWNPAGFTGPDVQKTAALALGGGFKAGTGKGNFAYAKQLEAADNIIDSIGKTAEADRLALMRQLGNLNRSVQQTVGPASIRSRQLAQVGENIASAATNLARQTGQNLVSGHEAAGRMISSAEQGRIADIGQRFATEVEPYLGKLNEGAVAAGIGAGIQGATQAYGRGNELYRFENPLKPLATGLGTLAGGEIGEGFLKKIFGSGDFLGQMLGEDNLGKFIMNQAGSGKMDYLGLMNFLFPYASDVNKWMQR